MRMHAALLSPPMTDQEVLRIIELFKTPLHVQRHCKAVADFAVKLGEALLAQGEKVNLTLVRHAALLHDFVRVVDFRGFAPETFPDPVTPEQIEFWKTLRVKYAGMHHADVGAAILGERGFDDVANVVRKHRFTQIERGLDTWEEKLVYYADKRAKHDKIVLLEERLADGKKRNLIETNTTEESLMLDKKIHVLEEEIFTKAGIRL